MVKKIGKYLAAFLVLCNAFLLSGCTSSPLVTGTWNDGVFTNSWADITFELPLGFQVIPPNELRPVPGQRNDFTLINDDYSVVISLTYVNASSGDSRNYTEGDYLNIVREQLENSLSRTYTFSDDFDSATIAGKEYSVMRATFINNDNPTEVIYQDGYAHRFVGTMIVFITVYSDNIRDSVDSFLASIKQVR